MIFICDTLKIYNHFEKFNKTLLRKNEFHSSLSDKEISDKEYQHVLNFWTKFEMKKMKDYHKFYLKPGVLFLADLFLKNLKQMPRKLSLVSYSFFERATLKLGCNAQYD